MPWTTTELLAEVRRTGQLPTASTSSLSDADLMAQGDRAMQAAMVPLVLRLQEEFFVIRTSVTLTAGVAQVAIPRRSVGSRVRDVYYVRGGQRTPLPRLRPEQVADYITNATGQPYGFYLDAANLVLVPAPAAADTLEIAFYTRPGRFVSTTVARQITVVAADTPTAGRTRLSFASWTPSSTSSGFDVISAKPPFEYRALDMAPGTIAATSIDFATSSLITTPAVGDWLTVADESPVMQVPVEAQPLLVQRTSEYVLRSLGYLEEAGAAAQLGDQMQSDLVSVLTPRTDGSPRRVTGGLMRLINRGYGGFRW